jgi:uncharacterized protein
MNLNWPALATLAAVALSWAGIWWLRKRQVNFSIVALTALAIGIPIGLVAGEHVEASTSKRSTRSAESTSTSCSRRSRR